MILANQDSIGIPVCIHNNKNEIFGRIIRVTGTKLEGYFSIIYIMTPHGTLLKIGCEMVFPLIDEMDEESLRAIEKDAIKEKGMAYPGFLNIVNLYHPEYEEKVKEKLPKFLKIKAIKVNLSVVEDIDKE